ncbi:MAG: HAD family phosphatase [Pseudomonadota bacterium]
MTSVIFDVGRVLIEWDPRALYRKLLPDEPAVDDFLTRICPPDWNAAQDLGRSWDEAVTLQIRRFPEHAELISAWRDRWMETVPGAIWETVELLEQLVDAGVAVYGLTNFSQEKWPETVDRFPFLRRFRDVVVSGEVGLVKPDPRIFNLLIERNSLIAGTSLFIDDSAQNISAAAALGFETHHFRNAAALSADLRGRKLI